MDQLPNQSSKVKFILIGLLIFLFGAGAGAGGFYFYSTKFLIPKYKKQLMSEIFSGQSSEWGDFFKKVEKEEAEYSNPFEEAGEAGGEEYTNPFELLE